MHVPSLSIDYRMCSLTTECVLFLQNVFSYYSNKHLYARAQFISTAKMDHWKYQEKKRVQEALSYDNDVTGVLCVCVCACLCVCVCVCVCVATTT